MLTIISIICVSRVKGGRRRKIELAKKIGAAMFIVAKNKKFMLPLPFPIPLPIPIFKSYQPVIHDPLFFKHQMIKQHIGGHLGGHLGGFGGIHG
uniref:Uncharacterized protein n=1 Tax=Tetranychus urticae TaxID=32264 RepID=T1KYL6_TETUR